MYKIQGKVIFILLILSIAGVSSCASPYKEKQGGSLTNNPKRTKTEDNPEVPPQEIDAQLQALVVMTELPAEIREKIKKALETKQEKKEESYGEILSLLQNINTSYPGTKFSKDSQSFLNDVKLELRRIIRLDKKEREREKLQKELDQLAKENKKREEETEHNKEQSDKKRADNEKELERLKKELEELEKEK